MTHSLKPKPHLTATERRQAVRVESTLGVRLGSRQLVTTNFSRTGMQVSIRTGTPYEPDDENTIDATIWLTPESQVNVRCRVVYATALGNECLLGLAFESFADGDEQVWTEFVSRRENESAL